MFDTEVDAEHKICDKCKWNDLCSIYCPAMYYISEHCVKEE